MEVRQIEGRRTVACAILGADDREERRVGRAAHRLSVAQKPPLRRSRGMEEHEAPRRDGRRQECVDGLGDSLRGHEHIGRRSCNSLSLRRDCGRSQTVEIDYARANLGVRHGAVLDLCSLHRVRCELRGGDGGVLDLGRFHRVRGELGGRDQAVGKHRLRDLLVKHPGHGLQGRQELQGIGRRGRREPSRLDERHAHRRDEVEPRGAGKRRALPGHGVAVLGEAA